MSRSFVCLVLVLSACDGGSSSMGDDDPQVDGGAGSDAAPMLDPADCAAFAQSLAAAGQTCGTPLPGGAQAQFEQWCRKGVTKAAMCGGDPGAGLDCFSSPDASDWVCGPLSSGPYPACNGDLGAALGAYCVIALGNPACASGIACEFDADCSNGSKCNSATEQCMSETAYCIGLPCKFDADCPDDQKCNGAEGACVGD